MKGIILAGGTGSRLHPLTIAVSKQLLPVYDKPMIYYPLSILLLAKVREILIICNPQDLSSFKKLLGDGSSLGIKIEYIVQNKPEGLAQAFMLGEDFIGQDPVCLILGDNIFYGDGLISTLERANSYLESNNEALIFGYKVSNPTDYGVVTFDENGKVSSVEEKPKNPKSNYAAVGLYFYPNDVVQKAAEVKKSKRGEYEISSLNQKFLDENRLNIEIFGRGYAWLDTGNYESLIAANNFVSTVEARQGFKIACIEEICYKNGWISKKHLKNLAREMSNSRYSSYLLELVDE